MRLSFWEQETFFKNIDVAVIGSGIVGLNAAWQIKENAPLLKVVVLERSFLPYGASTRNAGFACFGSISELLDDIKNESESEVFARVEKRYKGLLRLREKLGDGNISYEGHGGYEVFRKSDEELFLECNDAAGRFNRYMETITGEKNTYILLDAKIKECGLDQVEHIICNKSEGQVDTGKMMLTLIEKARQSGVIVFNGINISRIEDNGSDVSIFESSDFSFTAKKVLICNNGFAQQLLPGIEVIPARAQVLITKPVEGLKLKGSFHYDKGYYYFRNVGKRVLLGGGRNLDFKGETTYEMKLTGEIQDRLTELLKSTILPYTGFEIEQRWSGIMGLGNIKSPIVKKLKANTYCAVRMGGMGVAIGTLIGEEAAAMLVNDI